MSKARNIAALSTVEVGATADQTKADLNAIGVSGGRKNLIINGGMQVSQRGDYTTASSSVAATYAIDRFKTNQSTVTANKQHTTVTIGGVTKRALKVIATSAGTGYIYMTQAVELINLEVGATYTISCWMRSNHTEARIRHNYIGGTSANSSSSHSGGGDWEKISMTVDSTGTTANPFIHFIIYNGTSVSIASGDYIEVADVQLELGSVATDFEHRSYGEELALCQRYYEAEANQSAWINIPQLLGGNYGRTCVYFKVEKRASPSVTYVLSDPSAASSHGSQFITKNSFNVYLNAMTTYNIINSWTASAEL